ncbi:MAG: dihydroorotase, partial [Caulobacteraceae bacterium]|nr:dihydroorotase [Caulobacteraceae bacterium]
MPDRPPASQTPPRPLAVVGARLVDPASRYDGPGCLLVRDGQIAEAVQSPAIESLSPDFELIEASGAMLAPGLVDLRVKTGEPGDEPKETLKSAARAAAAGGVTSIVVQPDTHPAIDEPAVVDFILRRARDIELVNVYPAGAATKGAQGQRMAEIGLMREAGAAYVTDGDSTVADSKLLRRVL